MLRILILLLLIASCQINQMDCLTGKNCKKWNLVSVRNKLNVVEYKKTVSLKFCFNGDYKFYYLRKGKRIEKKVKPYNDMIPTNKWKFDRGILTVDGMTDYNILSLDENTLVLGTMDGSVYKFVASN